MAGQFLRIQGQILAARCGCVDALEVRDIIGTAKRTTADPDASYEPSLLASAYLLHLYLYAKLLGEDLYQLAEIHAAVGYVIENSLSTVALEFHVADFHIKPHSRSYAACLYHSSLLASSGSHPFLDVGWASLSIYLLEFVRCRIYAAPLHLLDHQWTFERHEAQIVARCRLDHHLVALTHALTRLVLVIAFAGILKAHLEDVGILKR